MSVEITAAIWGGIIGGVTGGIVSACQEVFLTKRRYRISLGVTLSSHMDDVCGLAAAYWMTAGQNPSLERDIIRNLEGLRRKTDRYLVVARMKNVGDVKRTLRLLHNKTTGGPFETVGRTPDAQRLEAVRDATRLLQVQLRLDCD